MHRRLAELKEQLRDTRAEQKAEAAAYASTLAAQQVSHSAHLLHAALPAPAAHPMYCNAPRNVARGSLSMLSWPRSSWKRCRMWVWPVCDSCDLMCRSASALSRRRMMPSQALQPGCQSGQMSPLPWAGRFRTPWPCCRTAPSCASAAETQATSPSDHPQLVRPAALSSVCLKSLKCSALCVSWWHLPAHWVPGVLSLPDQPHHIQ